MFVTRICQVTTLSADEPLVWMAYHLHELLPLDAVRATNYSLGHPRLFSVCENTVSACFAARILAESPQGMAASPAFRTLRGIFSFETSCRSRTVGPRSPAPAGVTPRGSLGASLWPTNKLPRRFRGSPARWPQRRRAGLP